MNRDNVSAGLIIFISAFIILKAFAFSWHSLGMCSNNIMKKDSELVRGLESGVFNLAEKIGDRSVFNYQNLEEAAEYIAGQFASLGYEVEFQEYSVYNKKVRNIIAIKKGTTLSQEVIIVGAHYDTCFNPGADDNASAVAGLIELARVLSYKPTSRTVKFIAFVNEEPPFFKTENMGSRVYVRQARKISEDIKAAVIFEMIGCYSDKPNSQSYPPLLGLFYPHQANFICVVGNWNSRWLVKKIVSSFKSHTQFPIESFVGCGIIPGVDFSDHWSFWKDGYPAVMITDTAFYRYEHYHSDADTYEKLDYNSMAEVVTAFSQVIRALAE